MSTRSFPSTHPTRAPASSTLNPVGHSSQASTNEYESSRPSAVACDGVELVRGRRPRQGRGVQAVGRLVRRRADDEPVVREVEPAEAVLVATDDADRHGLGLVDAVDRQRRGVQHGLQRLLRAGPRLEQQHRPTADDGDVLDRDAPVWRLDRRERRRCRAVGVPDDDLASRPRLGRAELDDDTTVTDGHGTQGGPVEPAQLGAGPVAKDDAVGTGRRDLLADEGRAGGVGTWAPSAAGTTTGTVGSGRRGHRRGGDRGRRRGRWHRRVDARLRGVGRRGDAVVGVGDEHDAS